jgi:hypothetical protein
MGHGGLHGVDVVDIAFVPGVDGLPDDLQLPQCAGTDPKGPGRAGAQLVQVPVHRQGKISNLKHWSSLQEHIIPQVEKKKKFFDKI